MGQKTRKVKKRSQNTTGHKKTVARKGFKVKRRTLMRVGILALLLVPAAFALSAYIDRQNVLHDLSVIGSGTPVLVQIHDPQCSRCQRLLSSVNAVMHEFPELEFRIANIKTNKGYALAARHNVSNVTLLIFDGKGERLDVASGLQRDDQVRRFIQRNYKG